MDWKLELIAIPVSDVDRAKAFYEEKAGFNIDHDHTVSEEMRFVQVTPPGSACSIAFGRGIVDSPAGSVQGLQLVVADIEAAHKDLAGRGVDVSEIAGPRLGLVRLLPRPRWQRLGRPAVSRPGRLVTASGRATCGSGPGGV